MTTITTPQADRVIAPSERIETLLDAAAALVVEHGPEQLTTGMVAARAQASVGTLYRFFADRRAVLDGLHDRHGARFEEALCTVLRSRAPHDVDDLAAIVCLTALRHHERHPDVARLVDALSRGLDADGGVTACIPFSIEPGRLAIATDAVDSLLRAARRASTSAPDAHLVRCAVRVAADVLRSGEPSMPGDLELGAIRDEPRRVITDRRSPLARRSTPSPAAGTSVALVGAGASGTRARIVSMLEDGDLRLVGEVVDVASLRALGTPPARVTIITGGPRSTALAACALASGSAVLLLPGASPALRSLEQHGPAMVARTMRPGTLRTAILQLAAMPPRAKPVRRTLLSDREAVAVGAYVDTGHLDAAAAALGIGRESVKTLIARARRKFAADGRAAPSRQLLALRAFEDELL